MKRLTRRIAAAVLTAGLVAVIAPSAPAQAIDTSWGRFSVDPNAEQTDAPASDETDAVPVPDRWQRWVFPTP